MQNNTPQILIVCLMFGFAIALTIILVKVIKQHNK
jgi:F0F1-type ATP synthase assembly protein I